MTRKPPSYRRRSGSDYAVVTLTDSKTGQRKQFSLGRYDSPESRELYYKIISEWEGGNRRIPTMESPTTDGADGITVSELCLAYFQWSKSYYSKGEYETLRSVLRLFRKYHGSEHVSEIGPVKLRAIREIAIGEDLNWSREYANSQFNRIKRMFKWAASREMIDVRTHESVRTLEPLKRGRTSARETRKVLPVDLEIVAQTMEHMNRQIRAVVELQICTAARPDEILGMRPCDINRTGDIWVYTPATHKGEYAGRDRFIYLGPKAQKVVIPFLSRDHKSFMFSPIEAERERHANRLANRVTPMTHGNVAGSNRVESPKKKPGARYTRSSYLHAIYAACKKAFPAPDGCEDPQAWHKEHRWHPYQLRHTAATIIRAQHGLEAAQLVLGHSSAMVTDAVYAERDESKMLAIASEVG